MRIYEVGGPIADTATVLARRAGMTIRKAETSLAWLEEQRKIVHTPEGLIDSETTHERLAEREAFLEKNKMAGKASAKKRRENIEQNQRSSVNGRSADVQPNGNHIHIQEHIQEKKERKTANAVSSTEGQNGLRVDTAQSEIGPSGKKNLDEAVDRFVSGWDALARGNGLPTCRALTDKRIAHIKARAKDLTAVFDFPTPQSGFDALFAKIRGSPFLLGQGAGRPWKCDLDWVVNESNFVKIMEGKYEKGQQNQFGLGSYIR